MGFRVHPLTRELWPALEELFESGTSCNRCWCMYWRVGNSYRKTSPEGNKAKFHQIVQAGPPPGLLAFDGRTAVGWAQLTSRDVLPWLDRTRHLERVDHLPVWCISCFYVRKGFRRKGVTSALILESLKVARAAGALALEAYPLDRNYTPSASFTGFASTFLKLGFKTIARRVPPRPIMRHTLEK